MVNILSFWFELHFSKCHLNSQSGQCLQTSWRVPFEPVNDQSNHNEGFEPATTCQLGNMHFYVATIRNQKKKHEVGNKQKQKFTARQVFGE